MNASGQGGSEGSYLREGGDGDGRRVGKGECAGEIVASMGWMGWMGWMATLGEWREGEGEGQGKGEERKGKEKGQRGRVGEWVSG